MLELFKQGNDYTDLHSIEHHIYSNFHLLQIFSLIQIRFSSIQKYNVDILYMFLIPGTYFIFKRVIFKK